MKTKPITLPERLSTKKRVLFGVVGAVLGAPILLPALVLLACVLLVGGGVKLFIRAVDGV